MSHDDFAFETSSGLPAPLPSGERLLWQGAPSFWSLAVHAYHVRKVLWYFAALAGLRVIVGQAYSQPPRDILVSCVLLLVMGTFAAGLLCTLAYFSSRSARYTITTRRVLLRHGIAVPMTLNVPFSSIDGAALKLFLNGSGDIALTVVAQQRVGYLITWPYVRPGRFARPQPSMRSVVGAADAARILADALDAKTTSTPVALSSSNSAREAGSSRAATSHPVAA